MNYNTEEVQRIAEAVAQLVREGMRQAEGEEQATQTLADFETSFREVLQQVGAQALGMFLSGLQRTPESEIACKCGGRLLIKECVER